MNIFHSLNVNSTVISGIIQRLYGNIWGPWQSKIIIFQLLFIFIRRTMSLDFRLKKKRKKIARFHEKQFMPCVFFSPQFSLFIAFSGNQPLHFTYINCSQTLTMFDLKRKEKKNCEKNNQTERSKSNKTIQTSIRIA